MEEKNALTITVEFSINLTASERKSLRIKSDLGAECHKSVFQKFVKLKYIHPCSTLTDKGPSLSKRVI